MIYPFFSFFDIYHLLLKFILTPTWATINTLWPKIFVDVALDNLDDIFEFDDPVLFTLQISSGLC